MNTSALFAKVGSASIGLAGGKPMGSRRGDQRIARRIFLGGVAAALAAAPCTAAAQPAVRKAKVAFLSAADRNPSVQEHMVDPLRLGLRELGHVEGQNLVLDLHFGDGQPERLRALMSDLMQQPRPDVLVTTGTRPVMAALEAKASLPIVAVAIDDPVQMGLAESYARPGRNITGVSAAYQGIFAKRLQLLKNIMPSARKFAVLYHPDSVKRADVAEGVTRHERVLGVPVVMLEARSVEEAEAAFKTMAMEHG
ncbi:MAG TPA: ABC transporter substrate binding protein [Burkholderiaceae bacterium]|nr:ABC transporter substrate binding protein [Burkholderiaceae bacterium]